MTSPPLPPQPEGGGGGNQPTPLQARIQQRTRSPSQRTPCMSRHFNMADQIEWQMRQDGHRLWGFVIYRTSYKDDADWAEFLRRLRAQMDESMETWNGKDILDQFQLTVFDDREALDNATTDVVRRHFQQWSSTALADEQQVEPGSGNVEHIPLSVSPRCWSPRYRFAIQVDAEALHSVVHDAPPPEAGFDKDDKGWVRLVSKAWSPGPVGVDDEPTAPEPIEGIADWDVGWIKTPYSSVMVTGYQSCMNTATFGSFYRRPPELAHLTGGSVTMFPHNFTL